MVVLQLCEPLQYNFLQLCTNLCARGSSNCHTTKYSFIAIVLQNLIAHAHTP